MQLKENLEGEARQKKLTCYIFLYETYSVQEMSLTERNDAIFLNLKLIRPLPK